MCEKYTYYITMWGALWRCHYQSADYQSAHSHSAHSHSAHSQSISLRCHIVAFSPGPGLFV